MIGWGGGQKLFSRTVPGSIMGEKKLSSFLGQETKMISPPPSQTNKIYTQLYLVSTTFVHSGKRIWHSSSWNSLLETNLNWYCFGKRISIQI